ncbi:MAG: endopeptidase La [Clostridia bacterium]|nr:endopeptidase La [Clostridia bacterium]
MQNRNNTENIEQFLGLPVIVLKGQAAFPNLPITMEFSSKSSIETCLWADERDSLVLIVPNGEVFGETDITALPKVGTVAKLSHLVKLPDGNVRVLCEGLLRARVNSFDVSGRLLFADAIIHEDENVAFSASERLTMVDILRQLCALIPKVSKEMVSAIEETEDVVRMMDMIASDVLRDFNGVIDILSEFDPVKRYGIVLDVMAEEIVRLRSESEISKQVHDNMERNQREYYLKEQLRVIQDELGYADDEDEIESYINRIKDAISDEKSRKKLIKEANKLAKIPFGAAEGTVIHSYLDTVLEYPWKKFTDDEIDLSKARKVLEADHDGIEKVKERVLEYLAVKKMSGGKSAQILCLVGAPGVGKTSVAQSIASAMGRKFVRISLGGVRDEAEIRGHRRTYLGSMPGRIVAAITEAGVENPLILLDEIDKMTSDNHGDPASALLEVLDGEQNKNFRDHFMEIPIDLSKCVFIATANSLDGVQRPLIDRMEVIDMPSYTREEKLSIAKNHLVKKQLSANGLSAKQLKINDKALLCIIDDYTAEAGVRNLERKIASICRKAAMLILDGGDTPISITGKNVRDFMREPVIPSRKVPKEPRVGVVNGMAYTQYGGDLLEVEAISMPGTGKVILTGSLGEVMKESAGISVSYIRSVSDKLCVRESFYRDTDIHVHFPEGAVPKDGPSAGVTVTTAIVSELTGCRVRSDVAMTGEISLKGKVLPIGGLREKTMAAYKAGVKKILVPKDNERSMIDVDDKIKGELEFVYCEDITDVLRHALSFEGIEDAAPADRKRLTALRSFIRG